VSFAAFDVNVGDTQPASSGKRLGGTARLHVSSLGKTERLVKPGVFKIEETDANVKLWIDEYVDDLQRHIDHAKIREEREALLKGLLAMVRGPIRLLTPTLSSFEEGREIYSWDG
jgi:hypothetical protein